MTPQPVTFVDAEGAECSAGGNIVTCVVAKIAGNGGEVKITLNVRAPTVIADTTMVNNVSVSDPDEPMEPTGNNSASASTLVEACFDVDGEEGVVTIGDIGTIVLHFGQGEEDPEYDLLYDIDDKGAVTISDIGWVVGQFGMTC